MQVGVVGDNISIYTLCPSSAYLVNDVTKKQKQKSKFLFLYHSKEKKIMSIGIIMINVSVCFLQLNR